ncbi:MAG: hypothetical protein LBU11_12320 [Zoogloeaceae bacterium]|jgi:hypothetical protein|nr:hypothetical protein [Zoogloeaceae bacterium]
MERQVFFRDGQEGGREREEVFFRGDAFAREVEVVEYGQRGLPGPPGADAAESRVSRVAGETLSALKVVWEDADEKVYLLDNQDAAHVALFAGIAVTSATAGNPATLQRLGVLDASGLNLTPGAVWLGAGGNLTQTPPASGFDLYIGVALSGSRLVLSPSEPVELE